MILFIFAFAALFNIIVIIVSFGLLATGGVMLAVGKKVFRTRFHLTMSVISLIIISGITFIVGLAIMIVVIFPNSQAYKSMNSEKLTQNFNWIQLIKPLPKETSGGTMTFQPYKGGLNGLNLQLINNIASNNYIKQWLTIGADCQNGELDKYTSHIPLDVLLGITIAEQGVYEGTPLPTSMFAWDSATKAPYNWNPAAGQDLEQAGKTSFTPNGGNIPVDTNLSGGSTPGPFQETPDQFGTTADYSSTQVSPPSLKYSPKGEGHNSADYWFFPDEVVNMDMYWQQTATEVPDFSSLTSQEKAFWVSVDMNAGSGVAHSVSTQIPDGERLIPDNLIAGFKPYENDLLQGIGTDANTLRCLMMYSASKSGWHIGTNYASYVMEQPEPNVSSFESTFGKIMGVSVAQWQSQVGADEYTGSVPWYGESKEGEVTAVIGGKRVFMSYIALTHAMTAMLAGSPEYAIMLQYAGVSGVNPKDMNTYLNHIKETNPGAWIPPINETGWEKVLNYPSNANPVATAVINYGMQWLRLPYSEDCRPIDLQTKEKADCSAFMWWIVHQVTGRSISSAGDTAYTGNEYQMFQPIPLSQAKPGDLIFFGSLPSYAHVGMVVSGNSLSNLIILNAAQDTNGVNVYGPAWGISWDINYFGNYQVYNLQPFYESCSIHQTQPVPKFSPRSWNSQNPYMMGLKAQGYGEN